MRKFPSKKNSVSTANFRKMWSEPLYQEGTDILRSPRKTCFLEVWEDDFNIACTAGVSTANFGGRVKYQLARQNYQ